MFSNCLLMIQPQLNCCLIIGASALDKIELNSENKIAALFWNV
jgi:hypothetical protein